MLVNSFTNIKPGKLWKVFDEKIATLTGMARPVFRIRNTPGRVRMLGGWMGGHVGTSAQQPSVALLPLNLLDS